MTFAKLIFRKIIKIVAIRCHILKLKCIESDFGWGSAADPTGGYYSASPDTLAGFKGIGPLNLRKQEGPERTGRHGKGGEKVKEQEGQGRGGK